MVFSLKKYVPRKIRKPIKKAARTYLKYRRSASVKQYMKGGVPSTTAIAKTLSNLNRKVGAAAEYKFLDQIHTQGNPDVALREFYRISASANQSTLSTTSVLGTTGYFLQAITPPSRGDDQGNFDGKKYSMESIQWKGSLYNRGSDATFTMYVVQYMDEDNDPFQMSEFLRVDNNSEYSVASKRNNDFKGYKVIASRRVKFATGNTQRHDFNILARPKKLVRIFDGDDNIHDTKYFVVIVASSDVSDRSVYAEYQGNTKIRFIH